MSDCHWGLTQWFCGIKEYTIDRCLCCARNDFDPRDPDRMFGNDIEKMTTNCCCINVCSSTTCLFNNPIGGLLCLVFAIPTHLLYLPLACCSSSKETGFKSYTLTEEENRKDQEKKLKKKYESHTPWEYTPSYTSSYTPSYTSSYTPSYTSSYTPSYTPSYTSSYSDIDYQKRRDDQYRESMHIATMNNITWNNSPFNPNGWNRFK